ncbi:LOW QUALITY PROTEIN: solute carrier family 25 member 43 [Hipposideros larvatus]
MSSEQPGFQFYSHMGQFVILFMDDLGHISQWSAIMAGSLTGMVSTIVMYLTDLIKTHLIVQNMLEPSSRGILHAFSTIYQHERFLALFPGVCLAVLAASSWPCGSLLVYMNLEKIWNGPDRFSLLQNFANVCLAAAVTQTFSFPFDTVKRKMQAHSPYLPTGDVHFLVAMDCFQQTVKAQGVLGLWNGLAANLLKVRGVVIPYFGVIFGTFEFCKKTCLYQNGYIVSPLSYQLTPRVDQSLRPQELQELKKFLKTGKLKSRKPTL